MLKVRKPTVRYSDLLQPALLPKFDLMAKAQGGVARLREFILALAVQGRLVQQDPRDEPASALLARIRAQRSLTERPRSAARDTLECTNDEDYPFDLPIGWQWTRLGAVFSLDYGAALPERLRDAGPVPVFGSNGIVGTHAQSLVDVPSIIVGRKGSVGAVNIAEGPFWAIDTAYFVTPPSGVDLRFAYWLLVSKKLGRHDKATAVPGINRNDVYAEPFAIPPSAEQTRIVARVDELMHLCDALEAKGRLEAEQHARLLGTLLGTLTDSTTPEELATNWQRVAANFDLLLDRPEAVDALEQTILQLAVRGLLVPQDSSDEPAGAALARIRDEKDTLIFEGRIRRDKPLQPITCEGEDFPLPAGWNWTRLGELVLASEAGWSPTCHATPRHAGKWGVLKVSAVSWGEFDPEANKELPDGLAARTEYEVKEGDFLLSRANTAELVARSVVVGNVPTMLMLSDKIIRLDVSRNVCRQFLNLSNNADHTRSYYAANASGTSSSMKNVSREVVLGSPVALPPAREQARIVARVTELRRLCSDLRQRLAAGQATQAHLSEALVEQAVSA